MPRTRTGRKSVVVQARLHTGDPILDRARIEAVGIWSELTRSGKKPSDIITTALLQLDGRRVEEFRDSDRIDNLSSELVEFKQSMEGLIIDLLRTVKQADPEGLRAFASQESDEGDGTEFGPDFINNMNKAKRETYQQRLARERESNG